MGRAIASCVVLALTVTASAASDSAEKCRSCHPKQTAAFLDSAMGRSIGNPLLQPDGRILHRLSNSTITIRHRADSLEHRIDVAGLSATYPVAFAIGAGKVGYSYLVRIDRYLFQSPASFYQQTDKWDLRPGYETERQLDFTHQVTSGCLFCHTGTVSLIKGTDNQFENPPFTVISCERCHGPSEAHLAHPTRASIVNPARLGPAARDAVCEQCHLEGEVRILNPGKGCWDFQPGQNLETVFATYLKSGESGKVRAVSQSEQLALSRCAAGCGAEPFAQGKHKVQTECVSCHMPRLRPDNVRSLSEAARQRTMEEQDKSLAGTLRIES